MTREDEMRLVRELGELKQAYTLSDTSAENIKRGQRIKEIRKELGLVSGPRANRRPSRLIWK